jgi:two-component system sensor histidine kinase ChiS
MTAFKEINMAIKTKILAVSQDQIMVDLLRRGLNGGHYEVVSTEESGVQLKNIVDNECPAFIILDIVMPSLEGVRTCLQLRQWTQLPIMMLSTWNTDNSMVRGLNLACNTYLTEPFGMESLKKRIELTLNNPVPHSFTNVRISQN